MSITRTDDVLVPSLAGVRVVGYAFTEEETADHLCPVKDCRHDFGGRHRYIWRTPTDEVLAGTVGPNGELHQLVSDEGRFRVHRNYNMPDAVRQLLAADRAAAAFAYLQRELDRVFGDETLPSRGMPLNTLMHLEYARCRPLSDHPDWRPELPPGVNLPRRYREDATRILDEITTRKLLEPFRSRYADEPFRSYRLTERAAELEMGSLGFSGSEVHLLTWGYLWGPGRGIVNADTGRLRAGLAINAPVSVVEPSFQFSKGLIARA